MTEDEVKKAMDAARPNMEAVPEFLQGDHWYEEDIGDDFLNFYDPYSPPRYTMERKGIPFANIGELHVVSGKAGHGKTNLMSQLMAVLLKGQHGNTIRRDVPHKVKDSEGNETEVMVPTVILYIDTEMGKDDTIAIKNRVCQLADFDMQTGKPINAPADAPTQFFILRLRDTEEATQRWRKILKAVYMVHPTDIFLDGVLDIVEDYNDQKECQPIIRKCMMLATHYDTSMWLVLHENPMVDKLVGTLGSITQRKVSEIFTVRKHKQSEEKASERRPDRPEIYFTVNQLKARGRDVESWDFHVTTESGWGMPQEIIDVPAAEIFKTRHTVDELKVWITEGQSRLDWPAKHSEFFAQILQPNGIDDSEEQKELLQMALNRGFLRKQEKSEMKKGQASPRLILNANEIKPFGEETDDCEF